MTAAYYSNHGLRANSWCLQVSPAAFDYVVDTSTDSVKNGTKIDTFVTAAKRAFVLFTPNTADSLTNDIWPGWPIYYSFTNLVAPYGSQVYYDVNKEDYDYL
jgi:hypothetical protein